MQEASRKAYPSDLTEKQWEILKSLIPAPKLGGRPREVDMREVINTILYLNVPVANGICCLMICFRRARFTTTSPLGVTTGLGNA
jgi:hypothetical protein